jgi:hypothetical protein
MLSSADLTRSGIYADFDWSGSDCTFGRLHNTFRFDGWETSEQSHNHQDTEGCGSLRVPGLARLSFNLSDE